MTLFRYRAFTFFAALLVTTALLFATPGVAAAQTTGTIVGTISDNDKNPMPGTTVTVHQQQTGFTRTAVTDAAGRYVVAGLPVGAYEIRAELSGFKPLVRRGVELTVDETVQVNLLLETGSLAIADQVVTVEGGGSGVNTQSSELSYLVSEKAIETLPLNGRNYTDLALLQPGVLPFPHRDGGSVVAHGLGMSINGQDPRSNVYLLDGTLLNDFTNGPAGSAAGTALGVESIREFRVEVNAYSAEFGRNSGGQINVLTKSGTNSLHGSAFEFHRNDALDARNYFDPAEKPDFTRNQFGGSLGGPIAHDRLFFFGSYESLRERLGRTVSTFVPDDNARLGILPNPAAPGTTITVPISPAVAPYLNEYPRANGPALGDGLAVYRFPFRQTTDQHYLQGRVDYNMADGQQLFARYTFDKANQFLPTDYPQFPRTFLSKNQFFTGEYRQAISSNTLHDMRVGFSRTRIGQDVEANTSTPLSPFVPGRDKPGGIDIGGLQGRFGPQTSGPLRLVQNVFSGEYSLTHTRGAHLLKTGLLAEHYQDNMVNPTFAYGVYTFASLRTFIEGRPTRFLGLTPEAQFDRYWRFTLIGTYLQDEWRISPRVTLNGGIRYEFATMPKDIYGRDSALPNVLADRVPTTGQLYENPTYKNVSPRGGFAWDIFGDGSTSMRGGYGLYYNTSNQQTLIVTVTNPPATPRPIIANPSFPQPSFTGIVNSIRPVQWDIETPRIHVYNLNVQRELPWDFVVTLGYAGSRGKHLLRSSDVNVPTPEVLADGTVFFPPTAARPNSAFTTIELKSSDGDSWYNAFVFETRRAFRNGFSLQSSYTLSRNIDTTQASTFFSDSTAGTTSAFPEFPGLNYNKGLADYHAKHNWVVNLTWDVPFARNLTGLSKTLLDGWQIVGVNQMRSGSPLTVFIQNNWSRSRWSPSLGPGIGFDRPSFAPGRSAEDAIIGRQEQYFDPTAFVLPAQGTPGNVGRGALIGPGLNVFDLALIKNAPWSRLGADGRLEFRLEAFNLFNHTNLGPPAVTAFTGLAADERPVSTFGRIRSTVTSSRQIQIGVRARF